MALKSFDIRPGDEVITAANTFMATVLAISYAGATPVLIDNDPISYNIDPTKIEAAINSRTKAIIPVHLQKAYKDLPYKKGDFPITERYSQEILSLPMFPELKEEQVRYVIGVIKEFLAKSK